jgi:uncharacterized protein YceK
MRLLLLPLIALPLMLTGCGNTTVSFSSNPGFPASVTGTIIAVQVESTNGPNGVLNTFTAVTIRSVSTTNTFSFCGDQRNQFPISQEVRVDFNSGVSCSILIVVVVL